jgi:hypothetical protein
MATANEPKPDEAPRSPWVRVVYLDEPDGLVAIQRINALLRSGGDRPPRTYRARRAGQMSRAETLGDQGPR